MVKNINVPSESALQPVSGRIRSIQDLYWIAKEIVGTFAEKSLLDGYVSKQEHEDALAQKLAEYDALSKDYAALKAIVAKLDPSVTYEAGQNSFTSNTLMKNGTVKLTEDIDINGKNIAYGVTAAYTTILNLNGHRLTTGRAGFGGIMARGREKLTVKGNGTLESTTANPVIWCASQNAEITLEGGNKTFFLTNNPTAELIYCELGTIYIKGGVFKNSGSRYLLNCKDANYKAGTAKIVVAGGKFYDFDPANNLAEGEGTSFVAEGYKSVASTVIEGGVEHTVYSVTKA